MAGKTVPPGAKLITFVARSADRLRGFDRFLNLLNRLTRAGEDVIGIAIGARSSDMESMCVFSAKTSGLKHWRRTRRLTQPGCGFWTMQAGLWWRRC